MVLDLINQRDIDYRWKIYIDIGYTESMRRMESNLYYGETPKEESVTALVENGGLWRTIADSFLLF